LQRKKAWVSLVLAFFFSTSLLSPVADATANKLSELERQKQEVNKQTSEVRAKMGNAKEELEEIKGQQESLNQEMQRLDSEIVSLESEIAKNNNEIEKKENEIAQLNSEIGELEKRIRKRQQFLMDRARAIQQTGGLISYIDVLLGANSFTDFISRLSALTSIVQADKNILEEHKKDQEELKGKKALVEEDKAKLESLRKELEGKKSSLESKRAEKDRILAQLKEKEGQIEEYYMDLQEQQELLAAQQRAIQKAIELEKKRLEELRKAQEQNKGNGPSTSPQTGSGTFIRPTSGPVTSEFEPRWGKFHYGIDIGGSSSDPVYAVADGVVSRSYKSSSYGNVIFITHYINGQIYTTVYAHLSSRLVGEGAVVKQGQQIGVKGTTGDSTGVHLHFEIHVGEWNYAKSNARNPRNFISF